MFDLKHAYEAEADTVFAFLSRFGLRASDVEDAVHDTFVTAMGNASSFDASRPLRPWLLGVAFRVAVARARHGRNREDLGDVPEGADPAYDPDRTLAQHDARQLAEKALAQLPEEQRAVMVLHDLQEVAMADIAAAMNVPVNTAYSRLRLARQAFKRNIDALTPTGAQP